MKSLGSQTMKDSPQPHCSSDEVVSLCFKTVAYLNLLTDIWVVKDKLLVELVLNPVHLTSDDAEKRLAINQDLDAILLYNLVELSWLVHLLEVVCQPAASTVLDADLDQLWLWLVK